MVVNWVSMFIENASKNDEYENKLNLMTWGCPDLLFYIHETLNPDVKIVCIY